MHTYLSLSLYIYIYTKIDIQRYVYIYLSLSIYIYIYKYIHMFLFFVLLLHWTMALLRWLWSYLKEDSKMAGHPKWPAAGKRARDSREWKTPLRQHKGWGRSRLGCLCLHTSQPANSGREEVVTNGVQLIGCLAGLYRCGLRDMTAAWQARQAQYLHRSLFVYTYIYIYIYIISFASLRFHEGWNPSECQPCSLQNTMRLACPGEMPCRV